MFPVGDNVRALYNTPYAITTNGWIGYVTGYPWQYYLCI